MTKGGSGILTIRGTASIPTYTGVTNVNAGTLAIHNFNALSTATLNLGDSTTGGPGAALNLGDASRVVQTHEFPVSSDSFYGVRHSIRLVGYSEPFLIEGDVRRRPERCSDVHRRIR